MDADDQPEDPARDQLDPPPDGPLEEEAEVEYTPAPETESGDVPDELLEAKGSIESRLVSRLHERSGSAAGPQLPTERDFLGEGNVQGVAIGMGEAQAEKEYSVEPGRHVLTVYLAEPVSAGDLRSLLAEEMAIPRVGDQGVALNPVVTGVIEAFSHRFRMRPAPGGISLAHVSVTAGTYGARVTGRSAPRNQRALILSNNHVLANTNGGRGGDCICQPGPADGGACPSDQVAVLERYVPILFGGQQNYVDCATAWAWPDRIRREHIYPSGGQWKLMRLGGTSGEAQLGTPVGKSGRTTQLTKGTVAATGATVQVTYGARTALFRDQLQINGADGRAFSQGGDSGSCIWTWTPARTPVGLLFAGGANVTFANRISRALIALDARMLT